MRARYQLLLICGVLCTGCNDSAKPPPVQQKPPAPPLTVRITGDKFRWHIQYPGPDGTLDTADDLRTQRDLHVPENAPITLELRSKDYVYSLYLPHFDLLEITLPGRTFTMKFDAGVPEISELLGTQMCGYAHPELLGKLVVLSADGFEAWQATLR